MSTETKAAAGRDASRIHNIGYRSYDGPRLGRAYARRSLFSQTLRAPSDWAVPPSPRCCPCCCSA